MTYSQVWWPILWICALQLTHPKWTHTHREHTHTHREHTHPEQWADIYAAAPGEQLGVRCLAQGHSVMVLRVERALDIHPQLHPFNWNKYIALIFLPLTKYFAEAPLPNFFLNSSPEVWLDANLFLSSTGSSFDPRACFFLLWYALSGVRSFKTCVPFSNHTTQSVVTSTNSMNATEQNFNCSR